MQHYQECVALGSMVGLSLVSSAPQPEIDAVYHRLWRSIFLFERRFSRFLPDSELSTFNRAAGMKQAVSQEFHDLLVAARELALETNGLFNPFVLPALQASGYLHSRVPGHEQDTIDDYSDRSVTTINQLEIGDGWARIPYGTALDLGGCGKGYLADQLRNQIPNAVTGYWLSFGGDLAIGGKSPNGGLWTVGIQSASDLGENAGTLTLRGPETYGVATSGTMIHRGKTSSRAWHHIIDPRTHKPAKTDVLLATAVSSSALRADVLASCAVILGSEQGLVFLKTHEVKAAMLQYRKGQAVRTVHFGNGIIIGAAHA